MKSLLKKLIKPRRVNFVLMMIGRSGSSFMKEALHSHPNINMVGEMFDSPENKTRETQKTWMDGYFSTVYPQEITAVGFKTKDDCIISKEDFIKGLLKFNCRIIHSQRRNLVKMAVSTLNARRIKEQLDKWNLTEGDAALDKAKFSIKEFDEMLQYVVRRSGELDTLVKKIDLPKLDVFYEDLLANEKQEFARIFDFLKVPGRELKSEVRKATSDDLRDALENFDELRNHYKGTEYLPMFDEVLV